MIQCLVKGLGIDVNKASVGGGTSLYIAAVKGHLQLIVVRCLVNELSAEVNQADDKGCTHLMIATFRKHMDVVRRLVKAGAESQAADGSKITAAMFSKHVDAPAEQTAYLEAKTHCSHYNCNGAGVIKCTGCRQARYCGEACQLAHWKAHITRPSAGGGARSWRRPRAKRIQASDEDSWSLSLDVEERAYGVKLLSIDSICMYRQRLTTVYLILYRVDGISRSDLLIHLFDRLINFGFY
jgi:ankyrin repeat protein